MVVTNLDPSTMEEDDYIPFFDEGISYLDTEKSIIQESKKVEDDIDIEAMNFVDDFDYSDYYLNLSKTGADVVLSILGGLCLWSSTAYVGKEQFLFQFYGGGLLSFGMVRFPENIAKFLNEFKKRKEAKKLMKRR